MNFCCENMEEAIRRQNNPEPSDLPEVLMYDPVERLYGYYLTQRKVINDSLIRPIYYCPFCGSKLPAWLGGEKDEYNIELEKTLGREGYEALFYERADVGWCLDRAKTPKEFQTDEWWIKRGL